MIQALHYGWSRCRQWVGLQTVGQSLHVYHLRPTTLSSHPISIYFHLYISIYFHLFHSVSISFLIWLLSLPHLSCCLNSFSFPGSTCFLSIVYLLLPLQSESAFCKQLPAASTELLLLMSGAARTKSLHVPWERHVALECFCMSLKWKCTFLPPLPLERILNKATLLSACSSLFTWVTRVTKCFTDRMRDSARGSSRPNLATPTTTAWSGCTIKTLDDRDCARVPSPHSSYSSSPFQTLLSLLDSLCTLLLLSLFSDVPFSFLSCLLFFTHVVVRPHSFFRHTDTLRTQIPNSRPSTLFSK